MSNGKISQLSIYGLLEIAGNDAASFLQGQLTCNIEEVTEQETRLAACCNNQGRVISFGRLLRVADKFLFCLPITTISLTLEHLKKFAIFSKVTLTDVSNNYRFISLITNSSCEIANIPPLTINHIEQATNMTIIRVPDEHYRCLIISEEKDFYSTWEELNKSFTSTEEDMWQLANIQQGIPEVFAETSEQFTPHELNLQLIDAISFNKGCYQGQEIIARMHYRGKLKQHMYRAIIHATSKLTPYEKIAQQDKVVGYLVNSCQLDKQQTEVLVSIKDQAAVDNTVFAASNHGSFLEFLPLPYSFDKDV